MKEASCGLAQVLFPTLLCVLMPAQATLAAPCSLLRAVPLLPLVSCSPFYSGNPSTPILNSYHNRNCPRGGGYRKKGKGEERERKGRGKGAKNREKRLIKADKRAGAL